MENNKVQTRNKVNSFAKRIKNNYSTLHFFLFITLIYTLIKLINNELIFFDELYYDSLSEKMNFERIGDYLDRKNNVRFLNYFLTPIWLLIYFITITITLSIGDFFFELKIGFKKLFGIVMISELILTIPQLIKIIWFLFIEQTYDINMLNNFYPFSLLYLFDIDTVPVLLRYPLFILNAFEILYWISLAIGISLVAKIPISKAATLVITSYGLCLAIWMIFITYIVIILGN